MSSKGNGRAKRTALITSLILGGGIAAGACALLSAGGAFGGGSARHAAHIVSPGMAAPDFTLPTSDGRTMHLTDYRGRAVFLAVVPSFTDAKTLAEVRSLRDRTPQYDMAGAKVMVVGPDTPTAAAEAARLHDSERLPFPVCTDPNGALRKAYSVPTGYRNSFVVTPKGQVRYRFSDAAINTATHGQQLIDVSKCCLDDVLASRAHGIGKAVGDFSLPRADGIANGSMQTLFGDGKQTATVVLFLSVKCPCANSYNDRLREMSTRYAARNVRFVGVYANKDETLTEIADHARTHGFTFPVFRDDHALCADHFGAAVTPEVFVLDQAGKLRYAGRIDDSREAGEVKTHDLSATLQALLDKQTPPRETRAFGCAIVR